MARRSWRELPQAGADRAFEPSKSVALMFSPETEKREKWLPRVLQLADHVIQVSRK
jgi:hypothetical protein